MTTAFHEVMGRLGVGDLHPGGVHASRFLLAELSRHGARRTLEVGAGIGRTTERMLAAGFDVTPLEPNPVLRGALEARLGVAALPVPFERLDGADGAYDAVVDESVFYAFELTAAFARLRRLLRPGGLFAYSEMLWTEAADARQVAAIHDRTKQAFGIAMAPREPVTWAAWRRALTAAGFSEVVEQTLAGAGPGGADGGAGERRARRRALASALARRPWLLPGLLRYRALTRRAWAPGSWLESRMGVWRRA